MWHARKRENSRTQGLKNSEWKQEAGFLSFVGTSGNARKASPPSLKAAADKPAVTIRIYELTEAQSAELHGWVLEFSSS